VSRDILAVALPDVRVERIVDHHVVFENSVEAFAEFNAAIEASLLPDVIVRRALVKVNVPTVIAARLFVPDYDLVQRRPEWKASGLCRW
jgi:hypothetical protein